MSHHKSDNFFPVMDYLQYFEERFFKQKIYSQQDINISITQKECTKNISFFIKNKRGDIFNDEVSFVLSNQIDNNIEIKSIHCVSNRDDWKLQFAAANDFFVPMRDERGVLFEFDSEKNIDHILCLYMVIGDYSQIFYEIIQSKDDYKLVLSDKSTTEKRTLELTEDTFKKAILWVNLLSRDISEFKSIRSYFDRVNFDEIDFFKDIERALEGFFSYDITDIKKQVDLLDMIKL